MYLSFENQQAVLFSGESLFYLFCACFFAVLFWVTGQKWFKGALGEFRVNFYLWRRLKREQYTIIKNVTLPTKDGTTQIDHIVVSAFGVFVIETKNMSGWIFGRTNDRMWTQTFRRSSHTFQNPLRQNHKHVRVVQSLLGMSDDQVYSLVVFVGRGNFRTWMPENVTSPRECVQFIRDKRIVVLSSEEVREAIETIKTSQLRSSFKTNRDHIAHVKAIVEERNRSVYCPKCGREMVVRQAKSGPNKGNNFWGCSAFPRCRAVRPMDEDA